MRRFDIKKLPNILTGMRLCLVPVFVYAWFRPNLLWQGRRLALAVFLLASATDVLDGYIARKHNAITTFGKLIDPLADKLLIFSALYCLYREGTLPLWYIAVIGVKELVLVLGGLVLLRLGVVTQSALLGKAACTVMVLGIGISIAGLFIGRYIMLAALLMHILALGSYVIEAAVKLKGRQQSIYATAAKPRVKKLT